MFVSFLLQIVFRYVLNRPLGWTEEVTVLCWVWVVLWGASFIVADDDEVRFDILYNAVSPRVRRVFTIIAERRARSCCSRCRCRRRGSYVVFMKREHSAYLKMRFDYLYSIYLIFAVACIVRQARLGWLRLARAAHAATVAADGPASCDDRACRRSRCASSRWSRWPSLGLPIGLVDDRRVGPLPDRSPDLDPGTAAEQILNGLYNSYVLLAVPLFILAADLMNTGSLTDRLLRFCLVLVGRFRGGLGHVNVVSNVIFAGMSGSAIADAVGIGTHHHRHDDARRQVSDRLRGRDHRVVRHHRADHPAVDPDGDLCAGLRRVDRLPVPRRRHSRACCSAWRSW